MDIAAAQELLGRVGQLDRIDVLPRAGVDAKAVREGLQAIVRPGVELVEPQAATQTAERMLASFRMNLMALSFVALIVGAYLIYNAVSVSVVQRRREVAILRSIGAMKWQISGIFALEAGVVGVLGGIVGMGLGALLAVGAVGAVGKTVDALYVDTPVVGVTWAPEPFAIGFAAGLVLALIASLVPAIEASGTEPALAMRAGSWEGKQRGRTWPWTIGGCVLLLAAFGAALIPAHGGIPWGGYAAAALIILGSSLWAPAAVVGVASVASRIASLGGLPAPVMLGARNFRHAVGRNAVAVAALMVGAAMTLGVATMVSSFRSTVSSWVDTTLPGAFYINSPTSGATGGLGAIATIDPSTVTRAAKVPGVLAVEGFRERILPYEGVSIHLGATDMTVL
jgi:putative ABC transport system permease protein